ncbi:MAG: hypothetical protein DRN08_01705 [Thermoplasmata archaeon]|nr:MAG: hypothetical protein DRN05_01395 [Thermoplasmata archaeon]RLF36243.1 MAG: hypothetical protein DRN08_01705 [Thermoplasmata archaeon]
MPHQCLKCGRIFKEGSSELLRGCPDCGGNRFFYTKKPLNEEERQSISKEMEQDITSKILELIGEKNRDIIDKSGKWMTIKPKEIRKIVEKQLSEKDIDTDGKREYIAEIIDDRYRKARIEELEKLADQSDAPETIDIEKPGKYRIDLKGLLEEEPIIIQKDGSYMIHLPSVFKMIDKEK